MSLLSVLFSGALELLKPDVMASWGVRSWQIWICLLHRRLVAGCDSCCVEVCVTGSRCLHEQHTVVLRVAFYFQLGVLGSHSHVPSPLLFLGAER